MWRISSRDGARWVQVDGGRVDAQPAELIGAVTAGGPVEIAACSGVFYREKGPGDEVAVFLRARRLVGGGARVSGAPPAVPQVPAAGPVPEGIAF